jgi:hypothetical protein
VRECAALEVQVTEDVQAHTNMMNGRRGARSPPCSAQRPPDAVSIAALAAGTLKT